MVAAVVVSAACSDDAEKDRAQPPITAPSTSETTSTTAAEPERIEAEPPPHEPRPDIDVNVTYPADFTDEQVAVVEAYRGYWHAYLAAADPVEPEHPLISEFATEERAAGVRAGLQALKDRGVVARLLPGSRYTHAVVAVEINGSTALLKDCSIDDGVLISVETGQVIDDEVITREGEFSLVKVGRMWKVAGTEPLILSEEPGVAGCAMELS